MTGQQNAVAALGLGMITIDFVRQPDGRAIRDAISDPNHWDTDAAHRGFIRYGGALLGLLVALMLAGTGMGNGVVAFFVFLAVIFVMVNTSVAKNVPQSRGGVKHQAV